MAKNKNILVQEHDFVQVITDGSASPRYKTGAWAAVLLIGSEKTLLSDTAEDTSQHAMELTAVIRSLQYLQAHYQNVFEIHLYTDSAYVLNLNKRKRRLLRNDFITGKGTQVKHKELIRQFFHLSEGYGLKLSKVEGHSKQGLSEITDYQREVDKLSRKLLRKITPKS